jgi:hypothetical protein
MVSRLRTVALATLWGSLSVGCGPTVSSTCEAICDCQGCSDDEFELCIEAGRASRDRASDRDCDDVFDALLDCVDANATCDESGQLDTSACESEEAALAECGSGFADICSLLVTKAEECDLGEVGQVECTPQLECVAVCILDAPCEELQNPQGDEPWMQCVGNCGVSQPGGEEDG